MPTPVINNESPYLKLFGSQPNYLKLRVFGCACYPWLRPYAAHKLDMRSALCIFLGYSLSQSAYLCLDQTTGRVYTSRHVTFDENHFPYKNVTATSSTSDDQPVATPYFNQATPVPTRQIVHTLPPFRGPHQSPAATATPAPTTTPTPVPPATTTTPIVLAPTQPHQPLQNQLPVPSSPQPVSPIQPAASTSQVQPQQLPPNNHPMRTRGKNNITKPTQKFSLTSIKTKPTLTKTKPSIPKTVAEALKDPKWRAAMIEEINAQIRNGTHELVPPRLHQNIVGCK